MPKNMGFEKGLLPPRSRSMVALCVLCVKEHIGEIRRTLTLITAQLHNVIHLTISLCKQLGGIERRACLLNKSTPLVGGLVINMKTAVSMQAESLSTCVLPEFI